MKKNESYAKIRYIKTSSIGYGIIPFFKIYFYVNMKKLIFVTLDLNKNLNYISLETLSIAKCIKIGLN